MASRVLRHLRGNVVGYVALLIALSGTAYATSQISKNAVRSKQIKDGQVKLKDLGASSVDASKVANGSLLGEDFAAGQLPQGAQGIQGPQGLPGTPGADATSLFAYIRDPGPAVTAVVQAGEGVTGVTDTAGNSFYTVTFNRNLDDCILQATPGRGQTPGSPTANASYVTSYVDAEPAGPNSAEVAFIDAPNAYAILDTSFFITAFC